MTEKKQSVLQSVGNAGLAAVLTVSFIHPVDTVKTRLQISGEAGRSTQAYTSSLSAVRIIAQEGGVMAFYKGIQAAWFREAAYSSLRIGLYEPIKDVIGAKTFTQKFLSGSLAGAVGSMAGNPFDVLKTRMMASEGKGRLGLGHHFQEVINNQGVQGLYRGFTANVSRAMILNATKMSVYDEAKGIVKSAGIQEGKLCQFMSAFVAGFCMAITVTPFDMVRTRLMNQPAQQKIYQGMFDCFGKVVAKEGPVALYKGFFPVWGRFAPTTCLQLLIFERLRKLQGCDAM